LAAVGNWPSRICHRKDSGFVMFEVRTAFVLERVAGTAATGASRIATLDHEIGNYAMERDAIVVASICKIEEVRNSDRCLGGIKGSFDVSLVGLDNDANVRHLASVGRGYNADCHGKKGEKRFFHSRNCGKV
jgi:hypothetical protein